MEMLLHCFQNKTEKAAVSFTGFTFNNSGISYFYCPFLAIAREIYEYITTAAGLMLIYNWFLF